MKIGKFNIQYAENDDYLWLKEHDEHISKEILEIKIKNKEVLVAKNDGKIIGWLRYNLFWDSIPFMNMICVLEEYWKMGIGKKLGTYWENDKISLERNPFFSKLNGKLV